MATPEYGKPVNTVPNLNNQTATSMINNQTDNLPVNIQNVYNTPKLGTDPVSLTCMFCKNPITTNVETSCSVGSVLLCICSCCCYLVIQACRKKEICCCDAKHVCPLCGRTIGYYKSC